MNATRGCGSALACGLHGGVCLARYAACCASATGAPGCVSGAERSRQECGTCKKHEHGAATRLVDRGGRRRLGSPISSRPLCGAIPRNRPGSQTMPECRFNKSNATSNLMMIHRGYERKMIRLRPCQYCSAFTSVLVRGDSRLYDSRLHPAPASYHETGSAFAPCQTVAFWLKKNPCAAGMGP